MQLFERLLAILGADDGKSLVFENGANALTNVGVVLDDQNGSPLGRGRQADFARAPAIVLLVARQVPRFLALLVGLGARQGALGLGGAARKPSARARDPGV